MPSPIVMPDLDKLAVLITQAADAAIRSDLEGLRNWYFGWLLFTTGLVVLGLAMEAPEVWHDTVSFFKKQHKTAPDWVKPVAALGWVLIIVGVAGEGVAEAFVSKADGLLQTFNNILLAEANKAAGNAKVSAEVAAWAASRANTEAGRAKQKAGEVARQANTLAARIANADTPLSHLEAQASKTKSDLINLAICNAPRVISNWFVTGGGGTKSYADPLRPLAGQVVFIEVVPDAEARRAALNIARTLEDAHWNVQLLKFVDGLADGVSVQPFVSPHSRLAPESMGKPDSYWRAIEVAGLAADQLLDFLHSYNWQAKRGWPTDSHLNIVDVLPVGTIRIQVGLYPPAMYVNPPGQKEYTSISKEMNEQAKRVADEQMAEFEREREKRLATLPPELRREVQEARKRMEAMEAESKRRMSSGPCQVLDSR